MHTILSTLAAIFVAHASPVKVDCWPYHGNWIGSPTQICGDLPKGSHVDLPPRHKKPA